MSDNIDSKETKLIFESEIIDLSKLLNISPIMAEIGGVVLFGVIIVTLLGFSVWRKNKTR